MDYSSYDLGMRPNPQTKTLILYLMTVDRVMRNLDNLQFDD